jgi:DNA-binding FadR family transcriptional regulator
MKASITIAAEIRARIARGDLLPGDPLPVEDELTADFGCSKPVIREALRILETEGLVDVKRGLGGGPRVRHPSISDAARSIGVHLQIGDVPVIDVWSARDRIIASAVERLAMEVEIDVTILEAQVDALAASVGDLTGFNRHMLDVGEVAVATAGTKTEHLLVAALRHIIEVEISAATARVDDADGARYARQVQAEIADAWRLALRHVRRGRARAARQAYERQAELLRSRIGAWIADMTVGDALNSETDVAVKNAVKSPRPKGDSNGDAG